jgi:hypothetical protein
VQGKKINNKVGGDANESRFGGIERELRKRKVIIAPSINTNNLVKFEQAWNKQSQKKDLIRITIGKEYCICERTYVEQALATLAQGGEILKYQPPVIK